MGKYQTVLFDLDGTLTDPGEGITNSVAYALAKYGIAVEDKTALYAFIGPPLIDSFRKFYSFSEEQARQAVEFYREYYRDRGMFENGVYEGIPGMLERLQAAGLTLAVATSKPEVFARQILAHYGLDGFFAFVGGSNLDGSRTKKSEVIAYVLEACGVTDNSRVLMVGDREHDILGAKAVGIDSLGVLFGYGSREELETAGAEYLAENVCAVGEIIVAI